MRRDTVRVRLCAFAVAGAAAFAIGLGAGAPQAYNRDNPDMVVATVALGLVLPVLVAAAVWASLGHFAWRFR